MVAKIQSVMGAVALVVAPLLLALSLASFQMAFVAFAGIACAASSATAIQMWFRSQASRSQFRRRQTSSRVATFAEAILSISWAATAGLAAAGSVFAIGAALFAVLALLGVWAISPSRSAG